MRIAFRTAAHKAKLQPGRAFTNYVVRVEASNLPTNERQNHIKRIFESSLGPYVSEATLANESVQVVLHVPHAKLKAIYTQLAEHLPEAVVKDVHPHTLDFIHGRATS